MLRTWLTHPLTRGLDLDAPQTTYLRRQIIQEKKFLCQIYKEWYSLITAALPPTDGVVLELGSGAGFLSDFVPNLITSEIFCCPGTSITLDGLSLPFANGTLQAIVMVDVLHHLSQPRRFFYEAGRCIRPGGVIVMIEPWVNPWSRWVYSHLHHEPFLPEALEWEFSSSGPLSGANGALPWLIFVRDRLKFEQEFPQWRIEVINPMMPFRYLVSGGVSMRSLMPGWSFEWWRRVEKIVHMTTPNLSMFAQIVLKRG